jgi:thiol-disulfide isomerase/thioredoxin
MRSLMTAPNSPASQQRRLWLAAGGSALAAGLAYSAWQQHLRPAKNEALDILYGLTLPQILGDQVRPFSLKDAQDKLLVLNFWATWCPPCIEEMPDLNKLDQAWRERFPGRVATIGLAIDSVKNVQSFYKKMPVNYTLLAADTAGLELLRLLGNPSGGLPFTLIVSPSGKVNARFSGRFDPKALDEDVRKLL